MEAEELEALASNIKELEMQLSQARKEYREKRTANLRSAIEARAEANKAVQEELKNLGYTSPTALFRNPWFNV